MLIFLNKVNYYPHLLPPSVRETIQIGAPSSGSPIDYTSEWYSTNNCPPFNTSTFFKGPILFFNIVLRSQENGLLLHNKPELFKNMAKRAILKIQGGGDTDEWDHTNFPLNYLPGLRRSARCQTLVSN